MQAVSFSPSLVRYLPIGGQVTALAGSGQGHSVVAGRADGRVVRWNLAEPAPQSVISLPAAVSSLAVNANGTVLLAADGSDAVLWQETRPLTTIKLPSGEKADTVALSPSGRTAVVHSSASTFESHKSIVIFDVRSGTIRSIRDDSIQNLGSSDSLVAPSDDELFLLDRGYGGWQRRRMSDWALEASSNAGFGVHNYGVGTSSGGGFFTETNGTNSTIPAWPTKGTTDPDHPGFTAQAPISSPNALTLSPDGAKAAVADSGIIYVSPVAPAGAPRDAPVQLVGNDSINDDGVRFLGDGSHLLSATGDKIALWDLGQVDRVSRTFRIPMQSSCSTCEGPSVSVAPDGRDDHTVLTVDEHGQIRLYDADTRTARETLPGPPDLAGETNSLRADPGSVAINSLSDLVAIVNHGSVTITDLDQRKVVGTVSGPDVSSVIFSGKRLLVQHMTSPHGLSKPSPSDGVLEVWGERGQTRERVFPGGKNYVWPPVANQQGTVVARRRLNGSIVLAGLDSGSILGTIPPSGGPGVFKTGIAFSPNGTQLITASEIDDVDEGLLIQRQISDEALVHAACATAGRDLTPAEWQTFVGTKVPNDLACR